MTASASDKRALRWMGSAFGAIVVGFATAFVLFSGPREWTAWASTLLTVLPGLVFTIYLPALRDVRGHPRIAITAFLFAAVVAGFVLLSLQTAGSHSVAELLPVIVLGLVSLLVTAVVAYLDRHTAIDTPPIKTSIAASASKDQALLIDTPAIPDPVRQPDTDRPWSGIRAILLAVVVFATVLGVCTLRGSRQTGATVR